MGLVYEPEQVGSGRIPADAHGQAQYDAAIALGESLTELAAQQPYKDPSLMAYMLYGSATIWLRNEATRRSDVDLLVVVDDHVKTADTRQQIDGRVAAVEPAFNVNVGPVVFSRQELEGPARINPFYREHLCLLRGVTTYPCYKWFAEAFRNNHPLQKTIFGEMPFVDAWPFAIEYLRVRREQFQTQLDQTDPQLSALKGPLELPRNLGRTITDFFTKYLVDHTGIYKDGLSYTPEQEKLDAELSPGRPYHDKLLRIAEAAGVLGLLGEDIERLHELDTDYTNKLEATVAGEISITDYESWLRSVYVEALERAFKVVDLADVIVYKTVELAQLDPDYDQLEEIEASTLLYPESAPDVQEFQEMVHRANQIVPVTYDLDRLVFKVAPKYPEMAERYKEHQKEEERWRRHDRLAATDY